MYRQAPAPLAASQAVALALTCVQAEPNMACVGRLTQPAKDQSTDRLPDGRVQAPNQWVLDNICGHNTYDPTPVAAAINMVLVLVLLLPLLLKAVQL